MIASSNVVSKNSKIESDCFGLKNITFFLYRLSTLLQTVLGLIAFSSSTNISQSVGRLQPKGPGTTRIDVVMKKDNNSILIYWS